MDDMESSNVYLLRDHNDTNARSTPHKDKFVFMPIIPRLRDKTDHAVG